MDQLAVLKPVTKAVMRPETPAEIYGMIRRAMAQDYSWEKSAEQYLEVYAAAERRRAAWE